MERQVPHSTPPNHALHATRQRREPVQTLHVVASALRLLGPGHLFYFQEVDVPCFDVLQKGVNLRVIQKNMGHKNIQTTLRYAHVNDELLSVALDKLVNAPLVPLPREKVDAMDAALDGEGDWQTGTSACAIDQSLLEKKVASLSAVGSTYCGTS